MTREDTIPGSVENVPDKELAKGLMTWTQGSKVVPDAISFSNRDRLLAFMRVLHIEIWRNTCAAVRELYHLTKKL